MFEDFMKQLFGGSSQETSSSSTPIDMTPEQFKNLRGPFADELMRLMKSGGGPDYKGPLTAGLQPGEQAMLDRLRNEGAGRRALLNDTLAGKFLPGQEGANPFFDAAVRAAQRPTLQGLQETLSRSLPGKFALAGHRTQGGGAGQPATGGSSAFNRAGAIATQAGANMLSDIATNMGNEQFKNERTNMQQAISLDQGEVETTIKNLQAQGLPRMIEDMGIERGLALFKQKTAQLLEFMKLFGAVTAPTIANQSQSKGSGESYGGIIPGLKGTVLLPPGAKT
jgi:hypothetical protein